MALIVLAGGKSLRMGQNKPSLAFGGVSLLERSVLRFRKEFETVIVVLGYGQKAHIEDTVVVSDIYPDAGPIGGIYAGLTASPDEANFVLACDMPFATPALATYLVSLLENHNAIVPLLQHGPEPVQAAYAKSCLPQIEKNLQLGKLKLQSLLDQLDVRFVPESEVRRFDPHLTGFFNVNTPEDYYRALEMFASSSADRM